jgi:hypothetical protein
MSIAEFYKDIKKNAKANTELNQLYKKPMPETKGQMPTNQVFVKDVYYQADVLYMPEDKGFKYILVCIDLYDGSLDAEPIKAVDSDNVIEAFKKIFKRSYLKFPQFITFDKGNEFKGDDIINYFKKNKTNVKYAITGRSRQLANVERANQKIALILFKRMTAQELITGAQSNHWVNDLKPLIKLLNKPENKKKPLEKESSPYPITDDFTGNLLKIGQKVRLKLDYPINNTNKARVYGKFRATDVKWTQKIYKITEVLLVPGKPPGYLTDANDNVYRTKNQLATVRKNEKEPDKKYLRDEENIEFYYIMEILDKRKVGNKTEYQVRYKGHKPNEAVWISAKNLDRTKDLRELKQKYNEEND